MPRQLTAARNPERTLLPPENAPWDVYPVPAELRVLLDGQIVGASLRIESQGVRGLYLESEL